MIKGKSFTPHHFSFENNIMFNQAPSSLIKTKNGAGFTLVEVLTIVGILIVLIVISVPALRFFQKESDLNNSTEEILNTLRLAQNKTIASEGASQYGVHFETGKYVLFKGTTYDPLATDNDVHSLPQSLEIYEINLAGGGSEIVFERVTGTTSQFGNVSLRLKSDFTKTKTIYIENSGQVGLTSPTIPSEVSRIKDSRHVHFDLGWSIQNATALKFKFLSPEPDQIEIIDMAPYFNAEKTEFNWGNAGSPFVVNGKNQVFQVHTHSLTPTNTLLCIHRDRNNGKNTEEVIIYIVDGGIDKDIVHYLADVNDTSQKGSYVFNSMERQ
jgi:Tfp pilus assembly protein FimT